MLAAVIALAGCGGGKVSSADGATSTSMLAVGEATSSSVPSDGELAACIDDYRLYRHAVDEYEDINGEYPASDDELINVGILSEKSPWWTVIAGTAEVRPLPGADIPSGCHEAPMGDETQVDPTTTQTTSVAMECDMERDALRTANEAYNAMHHEYATSMDDLVGSVLAHEPTYWTISPGEAEPVPRSGIDLPAACG